MLSLHVSVFRVINVSSTDQMHNRGPLYTFCDWQAGQTCPYSKAKVRSIVHQRTFKYIVVSRWRLAHNPTALLTIP